ncbi:MAG: hypothetical protein IPJ85_09775 [Flavobacteriales bacterium]|nr:hypothetical protein [Flavobacteriales bacterium]
MKRRTLLLALPLLAACVKDRTFPPRTGGGSNGSIVITQGLLKVNELVAAGSTNVNEFGTAEDWFEIYNTRTEAFTLQAGEWFVSDGGPSVPMKYELPEVTIPALGHLVIWCDNLNTFETQIHTNFALSSAGEHLVIYYKSDTTEFVVDEYAFGPWSTPGASLGRSPDGGDNWVTFTHPTPGAPNP